MAITRWGILGCGRIARKFASDLQYVKDARLVAVGSRTQAKADAFAAEFPATYRHDSYEALAENPEVDVIYIASPHSLHHEHTLLCLDRKKAVLCEKALALNSKQVKEMIEKARKEKVFLMEALWTKFLPHYEKLQQILADGELGGIRSMQVNFGFIPQAPVPARLLDPALGGGTMLDIGIYNVFMTLSVLGRPDEIEAVMTPASTGIDEQCAVLFRYKNGALAQLFSSFSSNLATEADINGNKSRIRLTTRFYEPSASIEFYPSKPDSKKIIPFQKEPGFGYQYEARHVGECLRKGLTESPVMTHADSLLLMETLDRVRQAAGIVYSADL
ncbi:MAG TPA: Gfo/Idh/MocA family oxidoreductase [Puia sp.]